MHKTFHWVLVSTVVDLESFLRSRSVSCAVHLAKCASTNENDIFVSCIMVHVYLGISGVIERMYVQTYVLSLQTR